MNNKITIMCDGGCGRSVTLRKSRVHKAQFYVCDSSASGLACKAALPKRLPHMIAHTTMQAAAAFTGITYEVPSADDHAAIARANRLLMLALGDDRPALKSL